MKRLWLILLLAVPAMAQTTIFNCSTTWGTAPCDANSSPYPTPSATFFNVNGITGMTSTSVQLVPANGGHNSWSLVYSNPVNDQWFTSTFDFFPNGGNLAFCLNNSYQYGGGGWVFPWAFNTGAGGEGGCQQNAQASGLWTMPYNVFMMQLDQFNGITNSGSFLGSSAQIYANPQTAYMPITTGNPVYVPEYSTNKILTSPVQLNNPSTSQGITSTDKFEATVIYTGFNFTVNVHDVTSGGTCTPVTSGTCFTYTWQGVNIPGIAGGPWTNYIGGGNGTGGTNAYVSLNAGTSGGFTIPALQVTSWTYATLSQAATPSCSPGSGSYGSTQSVTCTDSSSGSIMCASTQGPPTTDGNGNCLNGGTLYTGAISVPQGETLYVTAGSGTSQYGDSATASYTYTITNTAALPIINPPTGTYQGTQNVYLTVPSGQTAHYNTTGSPTCSSTSWTAPISVSSNETIYAVSCGSGLTTSPVASAAYVLNPFAGSGAPTPAASPTLSPVGGTYSSGQTVTMTCPTTGTNGTCGCYTVATSRPTIPPQPDGGRAMNTSSASPPSGCGCQSGTLYTAPFLVTSTATVYGSCGTSFQTASSSLIEVPFTISTPTGTPLTACGDLTTTGTFYLANDVTSSGGTCFWIDADNITLNLNGHTITYGGTTESLPTPGIVLADSFYTGIFQSGTTTNHNGFVLTGPGTIQDAPSDATIQNAAIWAGQTAGNISPAPSIKDVTFTTNGSKANAIYATFTLSGWDVENNVVSMNNNTPLSLSDRSAFLGMAIHIGDPEQAAGVIADTISNNTITAAQQGGIRTTHQNAVIDGNDITFNSKTSNDFCIDSPADGQTVHLNNCHPTSGRGLHVNASNTTLSNNTINVIELKQNAEYGTPPGTPNGCELDGTYGIQVEFDDFQGIAPTNVQISNNGITATAGDCDAIGMRMTSMDTSGTVTWTSNTVTTTNSAGVGLDYGISFDADQEGGSKFSFVTNTINSMHAYVGVGYDGNASTIGSGQTWNGTHAYIVDNANGFEDFGTAAPPRPTFTQTTTLVDAVPAGATSNVLCGGVAGGTVTINGTVTTCGSTPPQSVTISGSVKLSGGVVIQ